MLFRSSTFALVVAPLVLAPIAALVACEPADTVPTYHQDIAPLFAEQCVQCHQDGGIAPFPLTTYAEAKANADIAAVYVSSRLMPPSNLDASGDCRTFEDAAWLTDAEIAMVEAWVAAGTPEGTAPATALELPAPDTLDDANLFVEMAEPYTPKASEAHPLDDYRCFFMTGPEVDSFLTGFEIVPGQPQEVHHMLLFTLLSDEVEQIAQNLDDETPEPGWECFSTPVEDDINLVAGWAPGKNVVRYPEGTGLDVPGGRRMVMQIHYNLVAGPGVPDVTSLKLRLATSIEKHAAMVPIADGDLTIPPGEPNAEYKFSIPLAGLTDDLEVHGVFPHMHTLGKTLRFELAPLGSDDPADEFCMADVPRWDFNWQSLSFYEETVRVTAADVLRVSCTYDTTDRTETVLWGEGTQDEMCLVFVYITRPGGEPLDEL